VNNKGMLTVYVPPEDRELADILKRKAKQSGKSLWDYFKKASECYEKSLRSGQDVHVDVRSESTGNS